MLVNEIINKMRSRDYEGVLNAGPSAWIESNYDSRVLFELIIAAQQLRKFDRVDFWAPIYLSSYQAGSAYSDVFSFWMDAIYHINGKEKSINIINKNVEIDEIKHGITYHSLLYKASCKYLQNLPHISDFENAALMFRENILKLAYSNHSLRGMQYLIADNNIKIFEKKDGIEKNIKFFCKRDVLSDVWLIALDSKYFEKYFEYVWDSYDRIKDKYEIHFHLINPRDDQIEILNALNISFSTEFISVLDPVPYYASSRFLVLPELMDVFRESNFMITDADVLIREEIPSSLRDVDFDMAIRMKDSEIGLYPWRDVGAGLCFVRNNIKMREFFNLFGKIFHEKYEPNRNPTRNTQWWIDQGILYSLIEYFGDIKLKKIKSEFEKKFIFFPSGGLCCTIRALNCGSLIE